MFGYINVNQPELKIREYARYRGYYCGLCASLGKQYGTRSKLALSYDIVFLIILLSSLYEPGTREKTCRCAYHPGQKHLELSNPITDYAADMNMLCAWYMALDHKADQDDVKARAKGQGLSLLYKKYFKNVKKRYPDKVAKIESILQQMQMLEQENCQDLDQMAGLSGDIVAELFCYRQDEWTDSLRQIGNLLGRFIYMMDAWEDLPADMAHHCYNPLISIYQTTESMQVFDEVMHSYMTMVISDCAARFERLPLVEDVEILRNILYAGVWNRFYFVQAKRK